MIAFVWEHIFKLIKSKFFTGERNVKLRRKEDFRHSFCEINKAETHRKHFENLQPIGRPAFLGFVDGQGELNIPGVLREEQHQEDSPADGKDLPQGHSQRVASLFSLIISLWEK